MELLLLRTYGTLGTQGRLLLQGEEICKTIELPWRGNARKISCIPEGRYPLKKRYSRKFGWHFHVTKVPERSLILIHPANCARKELQGCIAPVTTLTGEGAGRSSRVVFEQLKKRFFPILEEGKPIYLTLQKDRL